MQIGPFFAHFYHAQPADLRAYTLREVLRYVSWAAEQMKPN